MKPPAVRPGRLFAALLLTGVAVPAQVLHRTADGSRFVLLPTGGPRIVHWALASPAGPSEDPVGLEGLSFAVLVASLYGTGSVGTLDSERERLALDRIAGLQRALRGPDPRDGQLQVHLTAARMEAISLRDPAGFRRVLAAAPVTSLDVHRATRAGVLVLTTLPGGVRRVAELLWARREDNRLRALEETMTEVRAQENEQWNGDPLRSLRSEAVSLAFAGHAWATAAPREPGTTRLDREVAMAVWRATQRPSRCLHVLAGNFDPDAVRDTLDTVFARTGLAGEGSTPAAPPRWPTSVRRATVPLSGSVSAVVAVPAPDVDRHTLQWVGDLLAGGENSLLAETLKRRGRQRIRVSWSGPVPAPAAGACLLLEVVDPENGDGLGEDCLASLPDVVSRLGERPSLDPVERGRQAQHAILAGDPLLLAEWLAVRLLHSRDVESELRGLRRNAASSTVFDAARSTADATNPVVVESRPR